MRYAQGTAELDGMLNCAQQTGPARFRLSRSAFTLIELLVVIAIIALLASLLLATLASAKAQGRKAICLNNFKQLHLAWQLYVNDNERFPHNGLTPSPNWVDGMMSYKDDWPDNTNTVKLLRGYGVIGSYLNEAAVFRCPSDQTLTKIKGGKYRRVRSVTMNEYMGLPLGADPDFDHYGFSYIKTADLVRSPVDSGVVFIDTHEDSISVGAFLFTPLFAAAWDHFPASRHRGAATLSYTDGHAECHKWADLRTRQPVQGKSLYGVKQPGNPDIKWLQLRASRLKPGVVPLQ